MLTTHLVKARKNLKSSAQTFAFFNLINSECPILSVATGNFSGCYKDWWKEKITNSTVQETDYLTLSVGYACTSCGVSSVARLTPIHRQHDNVSLKYGITSKQMFKILKNLSKF